jgi:hypothetical protein
VPLAASTLAPLGLLISATKTDALLFSPATALNVKQILAPSGEMDGWNA